MTAAIVLKGLRHLGPARQAETSVATVVKELRHLQDRQKKEKEGGVAGGILRIILLRHLQCCKDQVQGRDGRQGLRISFGRTCQIDGSIPYIIAGLLKTIASGNAVLGDLGNILAGRNICQRRLDIARIASIELLNDK